jgi:hypothetical protein
MPHFPRIPSSLGVRPELKLPPQPHRPIPIPPSAPPVDANRPKRLRIGLEKINPHTHEPDIKKVIGTLLGTEAQINESTGEFLYSGSRPGS